MDTVVLINGLGLDDGDYVRDRDRIAAAVGINVISLTLEGFEANGEVVEDISFKKHSEQLVKFLSELPCYENIQANIILWGFSYGADLIAYTILKVPSFFVQGRFFAVLNDPNINASTCTISRHFADAQDKTSRGIPALLRSVARKMDEDQVFPIEVADVFGYLSVICRKKMENICRIAGSMMGNAKRVPVWIKENIFNADIGVTVYYSTQSMVEGFYLANNIPKTTAQPWICLIANGHFNLNKFEHIVYSIKAANQQLTAKQLLNSP